jgi:DNA-binding response OmpR family regulator
LKAQAKIFLIDNDELITILLTRVMKEEGYEVRTAAGADDVMGRIKAWAPDVVLLDIRLPERSGIEVLTGHRAAAA